MAVRSTVNGANPEGGFADTTTVTGIDGVHAAVLTVWHEFVHDRFPPGSAPPVAFEQVAGDKTKLPPSQTSPRSKMLLPHGSVFGVHEISEHAAGHDPLSGPSSHVSGGF